MKTRRTLSRIWRVVALNLAVLLLLFMISPQLSRADIAIELITNGTFDRNVDGWSATGESSISWVGTEGHGGRGVAAVWSHYADLHITGAGQPVEISVPASEYRLSGWIKVPAQENDSTKGRLSLVFWDQPGCSGTYLDAVGTPWVLVGSGWTYGKVIATPPPGAKSLCVWLSVYTEGGDAVVYFDDVSLRAPASALPHSIYLPLVAK